MKLRLPFVFAIGLSCFSTAISAADVLQYSWKPEQSFVYRVKIVAEEPETTATYGGLVEYSINKAGQLEFRGGLKKSEKKKDKPGGLVGQDLLSPMFLSRPFGPEGPFTRRVSPFKGLESTTAQLELDRQGRVISIKGSSHLPYLLGHLSLLPFEPLDDKSNEEWDIETGIIISEARDRIESLIPFGGPGRPFSSPGSPEDARKTTGGQVTSYRILKSNEKRVEIEKTSNLKTALGQDGEEITVEGKGTWTFHLDENLPESLDYTHKLTYAKKNQSLAIPVSIHFERVSESEWAEILADREAESKLRKEEHEKRMAEQKAKADAPLTPEELSASLEELSSKSAKTLRDRLHILNGKNSQNPNPELAKALRPLLEHVDDGVRGETEQALAKFDPEFRELHLVLSAYRKGSEVKETPFPVSPDLDIPLGLIVLYREHRGWAPGKVVGESDSGKIELKQVRWPHRDRSVERSDLRLADRRAEQPHISPDILVRLYGEEPAVHKPRIAMRTWTDESGSFQLVALYHDFENDTVHLELEDGKKAEIPLDKLCEADRKYVQQLRKLPEKQNPFRIVE